MSSQEMNTMMKPKRDADGNVRVSNQQMNVMLMSVVSNDISDIHEMAIFDVPVDKEEFFNKELWELHNHITNFKTKLYAGLSN